MEPKSSCSSSISEKETVLAGSTPTPSAPRSSVPPPSRLSYESSSSGSSIPTVAPTPRSLGSSSDTLVAYDAHKRYEPSTMRLVFAHAGAALTLFLATTDATIVSTALPTITSEFDANQSEYTWISVTYMLTQTALQPLYGKLSDLIGRKAVLYASIFIFATGSALCGAAQNITWLILARAIAGVGGGGIVSLVWTITSEIVDVRNQAKWSQALSLTWAASAVAGPLLGGVFSVYMNIPICAAASAILGLSLRHMDLGRASDVSWRTFARTFDFIGLILFMSGSCCIVIGFNFATQNGWSSASTLALIVTGLVVLLLGVIYEVRTERDALFPPIAFKDRTIVITLAVTFLHNFAFNAGTFYLALYFQAVNGLSPLQAGMTMLPYSLGSSLASMPTAWLIGYWQQRRFDTACQKYVICAGLALSSVGFGLMMLMTEHSPRSTQIVFPLIAGVGLGMLFHAPYQVFTRALRRQEVASGTSAFFLVRFTGATIGIAVAGAVYLGQLAETLPAGVDASSVVEALDSLRSHSDWPEILHALSLAIKAIWLVCCPCLGVALLVGISIFTRKIAFDDASAARGQEKTPGELPAPLETV
ncbi:amino acid permease ScVBA-like protein [Lentinus tigrinus ALCF2SS1-7]|uniref:Amino acid permease ScVBA-like protein n=1 Tax=Lentinus tigrinus ALCF2SS1-6 TaxID=1328759 RepID=A0A5C2SJ96_9APHY|nr:amino acid permease ScVBA-like protein [Lentinus tigrinus ALCF2SS1-6]RPD81709.1 amino acid permease ScVBA-like protein [Lentinus tigrinus ALCF2SS1-7]